MLPVTHEFLTRLEMAAVVTVADTVPGRGRGPRRLFGRHNSWYRRHSAEYGGGIAPRVLGTGCVARQSNQSANNEQKPVVRPGRQVCA
jgi:hypothetical protein